MPHRTTRRRRRSNPAADITQFTCAFIDVTQYVRLCHWATRNYAVHKTTGDLYDKLNALLDRFVETYQGKTRQPARLHLECGASKLGTSAGAIGPVLQTFLHQLAALNDLLSPDTDTDLLAIRDEISEAVNQAKYLLTLA